MKILVYAHKMFIGGTQVNAIDLAAALRDLYGHDTLIFAEPGPMVGVIERKGLRFIPAPEARMFPSLTRMRALRRVVERERPDLVHAWDWWQCLDAYYAVHLPMGIPIVVSDMEMNLTRMLPKHVPTTFGTPEIVDRARASGRRHVEFMPPPIDTRRDAPGAADPRQFREKYDIQSSDIIIVTVSRLTEWMKAEGICRMMEVVRMLGNGRRLRLIIVGEGAARQRFQQIADRVNRDLGRPAVVLAGALVDPRPAYAAADIVVGMGGSALRGMAFGKPVVIVGERCFSAPFTPTTANSFYYKGIYGRGAGDQGNTTLMGHIRQLADNPDQRRILGEFSREFVVRNFSLESVCARLAEFCLTAVAQRRQFPITATDGLRTLTVYLRERRFLMR